MALRGARPGGGAPGRTPQHRPGAAAAGWLAGRLAPLGLGPGCCGGATWLAGRPARQAVDSGATPRPKGSGRGGAAGRPAQPARPRAALCLPPMLLEDEPPLPPPPRLKEAGECGKGCSLGPAALGAPSQRGCRGSRRGQAAKSGGEAPCPPPATPLRLAPPARSGSEGEAPCKT
ncbi:cuticle collagen 14-like [Tiliqua scincoides]|uniref:cuticle collagen 14-like n=1 Tax=Tiliqua scincoides TaxID=71010 RepID=UPI0034634687